MNRVALNMTTSDLDALARLAAAQRELHDIARELLGSRTSRREDREALGRRLNAAAASLRTVELNLSDREGS